MSTVRVVLPAHLRTLSRVDGDVTLEIDGPVTIRAVLDALEGRYPMLKGTVRNHDTRERRAFLRFFACEEDVSFESHDFVLPESIRGGDEPFYIIGAIAGGEATAARRPLSAPACGTPYRDSSTPSAIGFELCAPVPVSTRRRYPA